MGASIWFNKICQTYHVTPKYAQIHLKDNNTCNINIFRDTPLQMAFKPTNNISRWKRKRGQYYTDNKFEKSGIYIYINLRTCRLAYKGHKAWDISTQYKESY